MSNVNNKSNIINIELTSDQERVFNAFKTFAKSSSDKVFMLQGYAGTGKTTLVKFFIDYMKEKKISHKLLASTGRASKVLTDATGLEASTVHSMIYKFADFNQNLEEVVEREDKYGVDKDGQLLLQFAMVPLDNDKSTEQRIYIVDEASMISDAPDPLPNQANFGSGRLLKDLFEYDKNGKFVFVGDECQLPPILQDISPALSKKYLKETYSIDAVEMTLTQIVRQQADNSIIKASHRIRALYQNPPRVRWGNLPLRNHKDIQVLPNTVTMINKYISLIKHGDYKSSTYISSSNKKCKDINELIRQSLGRERTVQIGDLLMVTQNNVSGLMNGDMVVVEQIKPIRYQRANLSFVNVEVKEILSNRRISTLLIENLLYSGFSNLTQSQQHALFVDFYRRMRKEGINQKSPFFKESLNKDEYLNALRCVYGYAITCHKAQGGEWGDVFVDIPRNLTLEPNKRSYQWIYTAVTRAREKLFIADDFFISE